MKQEIFQEFEQPPMVELTKGLFTLYPLKGTYAVLAALQAEEMVYKRSENPEVERVESSPALVQKVLKPQFIEQYTLQDMPNPTPEIYARFYAAHPDLPEGLHDQGWPVEHSTAEDKQSWSKKISGTDKGQGQTR